MASRLTRFADAARGIIFRASAPFSGAPQPAVAPPPLNTRVDQAPPPPTIPNIRAGYHDRTLTTFAAPITGGFDLDRARSAMRMHRQGFFLESYLFAVASLSFGPVFAALGQRIAPAQAQPRFVRGGPKGLARIVREEVEAQIAPRAGLWTSPTFPSTLWGSIAINVALMGFAVLQHVLGDEDPDTGIRPVYTRLWPIWAVIYRPHERTFYAITDSGEFPILNDGKFTLVADTEDPHLWCAAILALADPVMQGIQANQARASYVELYGNPKPVATMPPKVAVRSDEGNAFFDSVDMVRNPDGMILLANGAELSFAQLAAETSKVFVDTDESVWKYIAAILLGSDGTISKAGVYQSPDFAGVRHDIVARQLGCCVRGVNEGHVKTYVYFNHADAIVRDKARGTWTDPVVEIPLPDPAADARRDSLAKRLAAVPAQIEAERKAGADITQDRVNAIASAFEVDPFTLVAPAAGIGITDKDIENKIVAPDEVRALRNLPALPGGAGSVDTLAKERSAGKDKTGPASSEGSGAGPDHERGAGGSSTGPAAILASMGSKIRGRRASVATLKIGSYSEDQERSDDGKFGSGGGTGSGGGKDGDDAPKGDPKRIESAAKDVAKAESKASKADAKATAKEGKAASLRAKADALSEDADKGSEARYAERSEKRETEDGATSDRRESEDADTEKRHDEEIEKYKSDHGIDADEEDDPGLDALRAGHEKEDADIERAREKEDAAKSRARSKEDRDAERADAKAEEKASAARSVAEEAEDAAREAREAHALTEDAVATEKEHADIAKMPDDEYAAKVHERARETEELAEAARKTENDAGRASSHGAVDDADALTKAFDDAHQAHEIAKQRREFWAEKSAQIGDDYDPADFEDEDEDDEKHVGHR